MAAGEILAGHAGVARVLGAGRDQQRVVAGFELVQRDVDTDIDAIVEGGALGRDLVDAAVDAVLLHLEVGNAVAHEPAGARLPLVDVDLVAGPRQLLGGGKARRSGPDDADRLAGEDRGHLRGDPTHLPGLVGDRLLDGLDGDRDVLEVQRAGLFAGRRADAAGELGEVVGRMQVARGLLPVAGIDEVVPVRNLVMHRAAGRAMAIGYAAVHAARGLACHLLLGQGQGEFPEVPDTVGRRLVLLVLPVDLEKACDLTHDVLTAYNI